MRARGTDCNAAHNRFHASELEPDKYSPIMLIRSYQDLKSSCHDSLNTQRQSAEGKKGVRVLPAIGKGRDFARTDFRFDRRKTYR
jgi:hypothetical protein